MKILQVIHGYPLRFNAGSEIYTQMLSRGLVAKGQDVQVFTREEDPLKPDYSRIQEIDRWSSGAIPLHMVNVARQKDRYQSDGVDKQFEQVIGEFHPDIVHFQHLNHLSLGLVNLAKISGARIIFTLHDFWLACPRGQFLQINYGEDDPHRLCDGQEDKKCATHCYSRYHTGLDISDDISYWTNWVRLRQDSIRKFIPLIDMFLSPSRQLLKRMKTELPISDDQIQYLDYGFDLKRLQNRKRVREDVVVFGYIGTHIVAKGIHLLIRAFRLLSGRAILRIWGRHRSETTPYLKRLVAELDFPVDLQIEWKPEYVNTEIVGDVFNYVDCIVVASIWDENSPLVIHEAQQCRVPVITSNHGGMAEYVEHEVNGLVFEHRNVKSLAGQMQRIISQPELIETLGKSGYLHSDSGDIPAMEDHIQRVLEVYEDK